MKDFPFFLQKKPFTQLKYIQKIPKLVPIPANSDLLAIDIETDNKTDISTTMSHASRRRHDSDNDHPTE